MPVSRLNFSGGFGDVIEEVLSPTEAMILSTYFDNKLRRGAEYLAEDPTLGFETHQVPSDIYEKLPLWSAKYRDLEIWRRREGGDKTLILIGVFWRGTPHIKITVLARFIVQPGDLERPRVVQHVTTLRVMKEVLRKETGTEPPFLTRTGRLVNTVAWILIVIFAIQMFCLTAGMLAGTQVEISLLISLLPSITICLVFLQDLQGQRVIPLLPILQKIPKLWKENKAPHIRACDLHDADLAEAKAKWEGG